jgi:hypothetical protein
MTRVCECCGRPIDGMRRQARYCSDSCRKRGFKSTRSSPEIVTPMCAFRQSLHKRKNHFPARALDEHLVPFVSMKVGPVSTGRWGLGAAARGCVFERRSCPYRPFVGFRRNGRLGA